MKPTVSKEARQSVLKLRRLYSLRQVAVFRYLADDDHMEREEANEGMLNLLGQAALKPGVAKLSKMKESKNVGD